MSYLGHSLVGSYLSAENQSVYSTAPLDWARVLEEYSTLTTSHTDVRLVREMHKPLEDNIAGYTANEYTKDATAWSNYFKMQ